MNAITTTNLVKKYGDFTAVDNLNLTIKEGELFSLKDIYKRWNRCLTTMPKIILDKEIE